jgi:hypothetical protein
MMIEKRSIYPYRSYQRAALAAALAFGLMVVLVVAS